MEDQLGDHGGTFRGTHRIRQPAFRTIRSRTAIPLDGGKGGFRDEDRQSEYAAERASRAVTSRPASRATSNSSSSRARRSRGARLRSSSAWPTGGSTRRSPLWPSGAWKSSPPSPRPRAAGPRTSGIPTGTCFRCIRTARSRADAFAPVGRLCRGAAPQPCFSVMCFQERVASSRSTSMSTSERRLM